MGNCLKSDAKTPTSAGTRPSRSGPSGKTGSSTSTTTTSSTSTTGKLYSSSSTTTTSSSSSSRTFGKSTWSGVSADEVSPEGRILEVPNLRIFTYAELKSATRNFKPETVLGVGGFGTVYKGWVDEKTLCSVKNGVGMMVAVKRLNPESQQGFEEWKSEVNFLGRLSHPNLVRLLGYCWEDKELLLVYEFLARGSLEIHLFKRGAAYEPLPWDSRLQIAIGAARGLAFLHAAEKQVIYRDFKSSNILLDSNYTPKLSDFGLAKNGPTDDVSHITTRVVGTYGYAAPEYMATGHLYVKSDVYGFGVVLLEILSGRRALDPNRSSGEYSLVDWGKPYLEARRKLARLMDPRLEGQYPSNGALQAAQLTLKCLAGEPENRPDMKEVVGTLEQIESLKGRSTYHNGGPFPRTPRHQRPGDARTGARPLTPRHQRPGDARTGARPLVHHPPRVR